MTKAIARWALRRLATHAPAEPSLVVIGGHPYVRVPVEQAAMVEMPVDDPFGDTRGRSYRSEVALELLDENVYGFCLLLFKPDERAVELRMQTQPEWMPLFAAAAAKVVQAA